MSRESLQPAVNIIRGDAVEWMENFRENESDRIVLPVHLDSLEHRIYTKLNDRNQFPFSVGRNLIRTEIVSAILSEFGTQVFGVEPTVPKREISDKTIAKYAKNARKK